MCLEEINSHLKVDCQRNKAINVPNSMLRQEASENRAKDLIARMNHKNWFFFKK